ncbi:hypothetical protein R5R35_011953 [Gryllus longicercus]|uniref:2-oxoglutarate dehydrogenase E1 component N-terminal domain-containing protein n=1 Tax=Gryllus longicercus TaxID=2509291 RepID=A0AAN9Z4W8_9ORTH
MEGHAAEGHGAALDAAASAAVSDRAFGEWKRDPRSVHTAWDLFFRKVTASLWGPPANADQDAGKDEKAGQVERPPSVIEQHLILQHVIRSYQVRGHLVADLDPLGLSSEADPRQPEGGSVASARPRGGMPPERIFSHLAAKNLTDLDQHFRLPDVTFICRPDERSLSLREIIRRLDDAYCRHIGQPTR